jgi:CheY-like chemotaxis protein
MTVPRPASPLPATAAIDVLLIEDDSGDVIVTQEAFAEQGGDSRLHVVRDGAQALAYLRRVGPFAGAPRPDLILLDLNLPRRDGREILAEIKTDKDLLDIPVVVFTTSQADEDVRRSYQLHANAYISKPVDFDHFVAVIRQVAQFYATVVRLPPRP